MIEAIGLSLRLASGKLALDALNLKVEVGEIVCLLGAKGAGKTTAIDLLLGFRQPTAGRARIDGIDVSEAPLAARSRIAYLADTTAFYRRLTLLQNLELFARLGGWQSPRGLDLEMALREVGLAESDFHRRVGELDPGGVRKLGIAAARMKGTPALLLDEPLSGLDPKAAAEVVELLEELRGERRALLVTMQELFWVRQLADHALILQEGRQVLTRTREELRHEDLERLYIDYMRGEFQASGSSRSSPESPY